MSVPFSATHEEAQTRALEAVKAEFGGPVVDKVIELIKQGITSLPAILAALQAAGIALPPWVSLVINILIAILNPPVAPAPDAPAPTA